MKEDTLKEFIALKSQGHKIVYFLQFRGLEIIFRPLSFAEYNLIGELEKHLNGALINDILIRLTVLYIENNTIEKWIDETYAGNPDYLAQKILDVSGFQSKKQFIKVFAEKRANAKQLQSLIQIYICTAFHALTPNDVNDMSLEEQLDLFCKAEEAINRPIDIQKILNDEPEDPRKKVRVPRGFETTDPDLILSQEHADKPDFEKLSKGEKHY